MTQPDPVILDMVAELTRPHHHAEAYAVRVGETLFSRRHQTRVPSLIDQLHDPEPASGDTSRTGGYESRPAMSIDVHDTLTRIDDQATRWVKHLGRLDPGSTTASIRLLGSVLPSLDRCDRGRGLRTGAGWCCDPHGIEADIRRWWAQARVLTGWDAPSWRPDGSCPVCGIRGALRIRLEERTAVCVECHETWDASSYQQLGEHIRVEADERRRKRLSLVVDVDAGPSQNRGW